jgi:hypothetical protein
MAGYKSESDAGNAPRLQKRVDATSRAIEGEQSQMSQSDYLQEALRPVEAGEQRIQGLFTKLECDNKGVAYFTVQAPDRAYKLRATSLGRVRFTAYVPAPAEVTCGARKNPENVVFTYRPTSDPKDLRAKIDGDAITVELVPKDFLLKK